MLGRWAPLRVRRKARIKSPRLASATRCRASSNSDRVATETIKDPKQINARVNATWRLRFAERAPRTAPSPPEPRPTVPSPTEGEYVGGVSATRCTAFGRLPRCKEASRALAMSRLADPRSSPRRNTLGARTTSQAKTSTRRRSCPKALPLHRFVTLAGRP
jgi:hypothetical protein